MENCIVCNAKKTIDDGLVCKMCGMQSKNIVFSNGFPFCSLSCSRAFDSYIKKNGISALMEAMEKGSIV